MPKKKPVRNPSAQPPLRWKRDKDGILKAVFTNKAAARSPHQQQADLWLAAPGNPAFDVEGQGRAIRDAAAAALHRRHLAQLQQGIKNSAATRTRRSRDERRAIDAMKAESAKKGKKLTDKMACRRHLEDNDPAWAAATYQEREKKVAAMAQRVSNRRRKDRPPKNK